MWSLGEGPPLHNGVFIEVDGVGLSAFSQISYWEGRGGEGKGGEGRREEGRGGEGREEGNCRGEEGERYILG